MRAWISQNSVERMVYSEDHLILSKFYQFLENECDSYDLMEWINETDESGKDIFEGDLVRVYGGIRHQGHWECDVSGVVEFRSSCYGILDADGVFHPFDISFDAYDEIKFEVLTNVYESSIGHSPLVGAIPVEDEDVILF